MRLQLPAAVNMIIDVLQAHGYEGFAVGGCVRDSVLNRTPDDWDITTSATPYQVKELFSKTVDTGLQHGTVTVMVHGVGYEVTTYRIDGEYEDCRHPKEVQFTSNLTEDLKRRDFTINALHKNPDPEHIPCFRVVNAKGELAGAFAFGGEHVQAQLLEEDGVEVVDGKVDLNKYGIQINP